MFDNDGQLNVPFALRSAAGVALIAVGLWILSDYGPQFPATYWKHTAGFVTIAAGVWIAPFLRRTKTNKRS